MAEVAELLAGLLHQQLQAACIVMQRNGTNASCQYVCHSTFSLPVSALQKLMAEGGPKRFYRGFSPCLARAAPANGIMLYTVDKVTALLNKNN